MRQSLSTISPESVSLRKNRYRSQTEERKRGLWTFHFTFFPAWPSCCCHRRLIYCVAIASFLKIITLSSGLKIWILADFFLTEIVWKYLRDKSRYVMVGTSCESSTSVLSTFPISFSFPKTF